VTAPVLDEDVVAAGVDVWDAVTFCVPDLVDVTSGDNVREFVVVEDGAWLLVVVGDVVAVFEKLTVGACEDVCDEVYVVVTAAVFEGKEGVGVIVSVAAGVPDGESEDVAVVEGDACGEFEYETFAFREKVLDGVGAPDLETGLLVGVSVGVEAPVGLGITVGCGSGVNVSEGVTAADIEVLALADTVLVAVGVSADESEGVAVELNETGEFVLV
jgi:hypothetical protein